MDAMFRHHQVAREVIAPQQQAVARRLHVMLIVEHFDGGMWRVERWWRVSNSCTIITPSLLGAQSERQQKTGKGRSLSASGIEMVVDHWAPARPWRPSRPCRRSSRLSPDAAQEHCRGGLIQGLEGAQAPDGGHGRRAHPCPTPGGPLRACRPRKASIDCRPAPGVGAQDQRALPKLCRLDLPGPEQAATGAVRLAWRPELDELDVPIGGGLRKGTRVLRRA